MAQALLSFEQAPSISVPFRFFLTAPLFAAAAGLLLAWYGPDALATRWSGAALALTHLLTAGFMLQAMCGALLQVLPVAAGANVWQPQKVAWLTHFGITLGALLLVAGFIGEAPLLFRIAVPLLGITLAAYVAVLLHSLLTTPATGATVPVLRLAVTALAVTVALGMTLAAALGWRLAVPLVELTHIHAAWGLLGWSLLLVTGVSYLVVPMFQLTPSYPAWLMRRLPALLFAALVVWTLLSLYAEATAAWRDGLAHLLILCGAGFGAATLWLQHRRRRRVSDVTLLYWRLGMLSLLVAAALALVAQHVEMPLRGRLEMALGVLVLFGVFVSLINGMLYKIVPFVCWLHLQRVVKPAPNMRQMLPEPAMLGQFCMHLVALVLLLAALLWAPLTSAAGLALTAASIWMEYNLLRAVRTYRRLGRSESPLAVVRS